MIIYRVCNKVSCISFESRKDAEDYLSRAGTAANGLSLSELFVIDASQPSVEDGRVESCGCEGFLETFGVHRPGCSKVFDPPAD